MGPYVDTGEDDGKKKKIKKGFKVDRRENYLRMLTKKTTGKDVKPKAKPAREKKIVFDDSARRDYLLTLHKKKNERRVLAFVDVKKKMQRANAKTRKEQREEARKAYNNFAKVPILPDYSYQIPRYEQEEEGSNSDAEVEEEEEEETNAQRRRRAKRLAMRSESVHAVPSAMTGADTDSSGRLDDEYVTVEVKPLLPADRSAASTFADLPAVVEQELRRLRLETRGAAKTKSKVHMMRELEKIRKIKKHSRKGHNKKSKSGKRKNRKK